LTKISGREDIVIGTLTHGRGQPELERIIGMFVNTLALRSFPVNGKTFTQFLKEVRKLTLDAFQHQDYPFDELVDRLAIQREPGRNPLFDVAFSYNATYQAAPVTGKKTKDKPIIEASEQARFDLTLAVLEMEENIFLSINYNTRLFKEESILRLKRYIVELGDAVIKDPEINLGHISISHQLVTAATSVTLEDDEDFGF
jgi:non-ribosomal peptide synthetase component F